MILVGTTLSGSASGAVALCEDRADLEGRVYHVDASRSVRLLILDDPAPLAGCSVAALPFSTDRILWMSLVEGRAGDPIPDRIALQGEFGAAVRVSEVAQSRDDAQPREALPTRTSPGTIVPVLPSGVEDAAPTPERPLSRGRAAWVWAPGSWLETPDRLWQIAAAERLHRFYLSIPVVRGRVMNEEPLMDFVREATRRDIEIWPVVGDPRDVLASSLNALMARTDAYLRYNEAAPPEARLSGLQLDIEPYLLEGYTLRQRYWRERYLATVLSVHTRLEGRLPLDLVLPVWWGSHDDWGPDLLDGLRWPDLSLTVMNYRTSMESLRAGALPFLTWGNESKVPIAMALEAGSVGPDEVRRSYERVGSGEGELVLVEVGGYRVLFLLDSGEGVSGLPGYRVAGEVPAPSSAISFAGDMNRFRGVAAQLEGEWGAWPSYAGIAIHGLDLLHDRPQD